MAVASQLDGLLDVQTHRLAAQMTFDQHDMAPYWGIVSAYEPDLDGATFSYNQEDYSIETATHWSGKIADPSGDIDGGLNEYKLGVWTDDDAQDKGADFTFRPGYPRATHVDTGEPIQSLPTELPESIRVQVEATNLSNIDVLALLAALADAIDLNPRYFQAPHEWSSIYELETYVRIDRDVADQKLTADGGVLERIARFSNGRGRGEHKWDHEDRQGHYEAVALDPQSWARLLDGQSLPKRLKCYHPANPRSEADEDDPLSHPKLEVQYWAGYQQQRSLDWYDFEQHLDELRETTLNALNWADISLEPDEDVHIADDYWSLERCPESVRIVSNPMPELEDQQQATARETLIDPEASRAEFDVLEALADGGSRHYDDIADEADRSSSTVYRAAQQFADVLEIVDGSIQYADDVVRQEIEGIVDRYQSARDSAADALRATAESDIPVGETHDGEPSALESWMNRHGIVPKSSYGDLELELSRPTTPYKLRKILRAGLEAAELSPLLTHRFENARLHWVDREGNQRSNYQIVVDGEIRLDNEGTGSLA